jgi:hypothetical protein
MIVAATADDYSTSANAFKTRRSSGSLTKSWVGGLSQAALCARRDGRDAHTIGSDSPTATSRPLRHTSLRGAQLSHEVMKPAGDKDLFDRASIEDLGT